MARQLLSGNAFPSILSRFTSTQHRAFTSSALRLSNGLVLGIYSNNSVSQTALNAGAVSQQSVDSILHELKVLGKKNNPGDCHVYFDKTSIDTTTQIAIVGLGSKSAQPDELLENIRIAAGTGVKALKNRKATSIKVDVMGNAKAAAEGAFLGNYEFDAAKSQKSKPAEILPLNAENSTSEVGYGSNNSNNVNGWSNGKIYAESQNWVRNLVNMPANLMTPTIFAEEVSCELSKFANVQVNIHEIDWVKKHNMGLFMSVAQGSDQPLRFVEIVYKGSSTQERPVALVGKGVTFDSGGISIKPSRGMEDMKGDMGGAGSVVGAMRGIAAMGLPIYAVACIPLCENLINGVATKPGDVHRGMNGKTVEILNTDAEGRLILADALTYTVDTYKPTALVDVATLTGAMMVALGETYSGVFTSSNKLWSLLDQASRSTGDSLWRMPLHKAYLKAMESKVADIGNISAGPGGGACTAAMFLKEFLGTPPKSEAEDNAATKAGDQAPKPAVYDINAEEGAIKWAHMDIAGSMDTKNGSGYNVGGMTGRPTRTLIEFMARVADQPL